MKTSNSYYFLRLLARLLDFLLIALIAKLAEAVNPHLETSPFVWFLVYNALVVLFNGRTIGKYSFSLTVATPQKGVKRITRLASRELLAVLLFPLLVFNVLFIAPQPLHDRLSGTKVIKT